MIPITSRFATSRHGSCEAPEGPCASSLYFPNLLLEEFGPHYRRASLHVHAPCIQTSGFVLNLPIRCHDEEAFLIFEELIAATWYVAVLSVYDFEIMFLFLFGLLMRDYCILMNQNVGILQRHFLVGPLSSSNQYLSKSLRLCEPRGDWGLQNKWLCK